MRRGWYRSGYRGLAAVMTYLDEKLGMSVIALILAVVAFLFVTPASFWFQVTKLDVHDAETSAGLTVDFDRTIRREFEGRWRIDVRREVAPDQWEWVCATDWKAQHYSPDAVLPVPVTLEWLAYTDPRCFDLEKPGKYSIDVFWDIWPGSLLFERNVRRADTFTIFGVAP
jgi:hypothetical protein